MNVEAQVRSGAASVCILLSLLCIAEASIWLAGRVLFRRSYRIVVPASRNSSLITATLGTLPMAMFALTESGARACACSVLVAAALHPVSPGPERTVGVVAVRAASLLNSRAACILCFLASLGRLRMYQRRTHFLAVLFVYFSFA